jgi:hypothetical protein
MRAALSILATLFVLHAAPATVWEATLAESNGTELLVRMHVERNGARWAMYSRPGGVLPMIPWRQRLLGRLLRRLPPHGALIHLTDGTARAVGDSVVLRGTLESPFLGKRVLVGWMKGDRMQAELRRGSDTGAVGGTLSAVPARRSGSSRDYPAIARNVHQTISDLVFEAALPRSPGFVRFFAEFDKAAARATDDLDLVVAFTTLSPLLKTSHFNFIRNPVIAATPLDSLIERNSNVDPASFVRLQFPAAGLADLQVRRWDRVGPAIDRAFERIDSAKVRVLMLDIRGNPGGDPSAFVPLTHLLRDTTWIGAAVGRKWYANNSRHPSIADYSAFPVISSANEARELLHLVTRGGAAAGRIAPRAPYFAGTMYLLINEGTGSASELVAHTLKMTKRATLVGQRTAGALLTALPHPVGDGFIVTVPEADFIAADGTRIEGNGVEPDLRANGGEAMIVVGEQVRRELPYAGAVWLGFSYMTLRRYDESERAWLEALALAPTDASKRAIEARLAAARNAKR